MSTNPTTEPLVRLYNRSNRSFIHGKYIAAPNSFVEVPEKVAAIWLDHFPTQVIGGAQANKELGGAQAELNALKAEHEKALAENAKLKAELEKKKTV